MSVNVLLDVGLENVHLHLVSSEFQHLYTITGIYEVMYLHLLLLHLQLSTGSLS